MLARVERRFFGEPVVFVGVHSPKFPHERGVEALREAVGRLGVRHPVVSDPGHATWHAYAVRAWPTLVFVDPDGRVIGSVPGEPEAGPLEQAIRGLLARCREAGMELAASPLPLRPEPTPAGALAWPAKVAAGAGRLYVADAGHHQVVEYDLPPRGPARPLRRFGDGVPGLVDGPGEAARFHHPAGLGLDAAGVLWLADAGNHAVRRVALSSGEVETVAGTGAKGTASLEPHAFSAGRELALRSPWDLALDPAGPGGRPRLVIAMAGAHQLWSLDPARGQIQVLAGAGPEGRRDGPAFEAFFAQPSGLALSGGRVFVADAESGAVRVLELAAGEVSTLAGGDLWDHGDRDGAGEVARFQHPSGLAVLPDGALLVADTYNHALRRVDTATGRVETFAGGPALREPGGLCVDAGRVFVADTAHHRVVAIALATGEAEVVAG